MSVTLNPDNPLVGRGSELSLLVARLEEVATGRGGVALLAGEPGIGKTRLARASATEAERNGALVLWGRCFDGDWAPPFAPWIEAIGGYSRTVTPEELQTTVGVEGQSTANPLTTFIPELAFLAQGLSALAPLGADEDRARLHDAVVRFFANLSAVQPVVVVLDDVQWADSASLDLLRHLAFVSVNMRLLLVATYRDIELTARHPLSALLPVLRREARAVPIALKGLTAGDVESLISGASPTPWSTRIATAIQSETKGNPFFIEELLRHLVDEAQ